MALFDAGDTLNVARYKLTTGALLTDTGVAGNALTLTNTGSVPNADGHGGGTNLAASFDGAGQYLSHADNAAYDLAGAWTISAWVYLDSSTGASRAIVAKMGSTGEESYTLYVSATGKVVGRVSLNGSSVTLIAGSTTLSASTWYIATLRFDGSNLKLSLNGASDATPVALSGTTFNSNHLFTIGYNYWHGWDFAGRIDDVSVWKRVLTDAEVLALYDSYQDDFAVTMFSGEDTLNVARYKLTTGALLTDTGVAGNALTLTNTGSVPNADGHGGGTNLAASFNGAGQYLSHADNAAYDLAGAWTISAWVYLDSSTGAIRAIVAKMGSTGEESYTLYVSATGTVVGRVSLNGSTVTSIAGSTTLSASTWYIATLRFDGSNLKLSLNGISDATPVALSGTTFNSNHLFTIGYNYWHGWDFAGRIDDVSVWKRVLTDAEVLALYDSYQDDFVLVPPGTFFGSGGAVAGGAGQVHTEKFFIGSGGAVTGGAGQVHTEKFFIGSGGAVTGGAGQVLFGNMAVFIGSGGAVAGGSGLVHTEKFFTGSGGAVAGGAGLFSFTISANLEPILWSLFDANGDPITGASPTVKILREADQYLWDFADSTFKNSGWTTLAQVMSEISPTNLPGYYKQVINVALLANGRYHAITTYGGTPKQNGALEFFVDDGQLVDEYVAGRVDLLQTNMALLPSAAQIEAALLDTEHGLETGITVRDGLRLKAAVLAGKVSGGGTGTETFKGVGVETVRVISTVDANGNRTAVAVTP